MRRLIYLLVIVIFGVTACNIASEKSTKSPDTPTISSLLLQNSINGESIYIVYCAECHGLNGEGENPEDLFNGDVAPPHDNTGHTWHHDDDLLIEIVTQGGISDRMPAFGDQLIAEQIETVLTYIKTLWTDEQRSYQNEVTQVVRGQ